MNLLSGRRFWSKSFPMWLCHIMSSCLMLLLKKGFACKLPVFAFLLEMQLKWYNLQFSCKFFFHCPHLSSCVWFLVSLPYSFILIPDQVKWRPAKGIENDSTRKHATSEYRPVWLWSVTLQSLGCQEQRWWLMPKAVTSPHPPRLVSETKVLTLLKLKLIVVSFRPSSSCHPSSACEFMCLKRKYMLLQKSASGLFLFLLSRSCIYLKSSQKFGDIITWVYRCCFIDWHVRKCELFCI